MNDKKARIPCFVAGLSVLVLLLNLIPLAGLTAWAASTELFLSEYVEGSSLNKALEIYNGTGAAIDLAAGGYSIEIYFNGSTTAGTTIALTGVVANGDVYVVADDGADAAILAETDQTSTSNFFNGDDAVALLKDGAVIDVIGQVGTDPGSEWSGGGIGTQNETLRRKADVCAGDGNVNDAFDPSLEWDGFPQDTFDGLGDHTANCEEPTPEVSISEIRIDQPGTDNDEYLELEAEAGTSLEGLTYLVIGDGTGGSGVIEAVVDLSGQAVPASGYFVAAESTFSLGSADLTTSLNFENDDNVTHLLVSGFSGANGDDLDTDDDGVLDVTPWAALLDLIALVEEENPPAATEFHYGPPSIGPDGSYVPGHVFRCTDGWQIGQFDTVDGNDTPGAANDCQVPTLDLVINEIDYDQPSTDTAEYVEIKNVGTSAVDLAGIDLVLVNGTGGGAAVYNTIALPAVSLAADDYFVVCANAATVANCDLDASPDTDFIQNGAPDAVALVQGDTIVDTVSYEGDSGAPYTEGSGAGLADVSDEGMGISRCPDGADTDQNNADFLFQPITPGAANYCEPPEACGDPFTTIYTIQGNGSASPLDGTEVATEGVVVGDLQVGGREGFFIQDATGDGDATTSDGIFVYSTSLDVNVGDSVRVRGYVDEFFDLTEITSVSQVWLCSTGNSVTPTALDLPVTSVDDFEAYEGMLVTFPQSLYISEYFDFDRYGEIVLTTERQFQPTAIYEPGSPEAAQLAQANQLSRVTLDDGRSWQNPDPALHPNGGIFDLNNLFRGGDRLENVTGVMDFYYGYKIQPTQGANYTAANPRTALPDDVGGNLKVASFNVLNYFTTLGSRGADDSLEFERQRAKIFDALAKIDADVVGLIEIENNGTAVQNLVAGLNDLMGAETYAYIDTGVIGVDEITVAFIYKPATVSLVGGFAVLDDPTFTDPLGYGEQKSRPALAQTFMDNTTGGVFTVVVNHLKSKSSACGEGDDDAEQGNCNLTRTLGAQALVDWLATDPTGSGDADFLIIGDLNAYDKEDPIDVILAGGYTDLVSLYEGEYAYSYVFDGQLGYLDHALANSELVNEVTGLTVWHINADEPDLIDYDMTYKQDAQDAIYAPDAYRSSDHDPVISGLNVCDEIAPTLSVSVDPDTLWPPNHKYVEVVATVVVTDNFDPNPTVILVSVTSNEPDEGGKPNDIVIVDDFTFKLRAERSGGGDGRIYTITYQATDFCGNSTVATATVTVPHDQSE